MRRRYWLCALSFLVAMAGSGQAAADTYVYRVIHPTYGEIGTYTNIVDRNGDATDVRSELRVAVRILGITVYRQEARRMEHWRHDRLISFQGVTLTNGNPLEVHGEARADGFAITTPSGTVLAPTNVHPSNPWSAMVLNTDMMMSTRTGRLIPVRVSGGEVEPVALGGATMSLHQYDVVSDKHQLVWLDDRGTPMGFRTVEDGEPIDFVLSPRS